MVSTQRHHPPRGGSASTSSPRPSYRARGFMALRRAAFAPLGSRVPDAALGRWVSADAVDEGWSSSSSLSSKSVRRSSFRSSHQNVLMPNHTNQIHHPTSDQTRRAQTPMPSWIAGRCCRTGRSRTGWSFQACQSSATLGPGVGWVARWGGCVVGSVARG